MLGYAVWAICRYEALALETGKVPTITSITWRRRTTHPRLTRVAVFACLAWAWWHLLFEKVKVFK